MYVSIDFPQDNFILGALGQKQVPEPVHTVHVGVMDVGGEDWRLHVGSGEGGVLVVPVEGLVEEVLMAPPVPDLHQVVARARSKAVLEGVRRTGAEVSHIIAVVEKGPGLAKLQAEYPEVIIESLVRLEMDGDRIILLDEA